MLTKEQFTVLESELNISLNDIQKMTKDEWDDVRVQCFIIESDETEILEDGSAEITEKGRIAAEIADISYKRMKSDEV